MKKILYIDMDGVIADFELGAQRWLNTHQKYSQLYSNNPDQIHGIFRDLQPIENAIESIDKLYRSGEYELFIATTSPWNNPSASTDKRYWIEKYFGELFTRKIFTTHRKDLLIGDYLIDDRIVNGAGGFTGELLLFGKNNPYPNWKSILEKLL